MSEFRESFWLFVGATGPIIALANVVTFGQATDALADQRNEDRRLQAESAKLDKRSRFFRLLRRSHIYWVGLCFASSVVLTTLASIALWQRDDVADGPIVVVLMVLTFLLLFVLSACSAALIRRAHERDAERARKVLIEIMGRDAPAWAHPGDDGGDATGDARELAELRSLGSGAEPVASGDDAPDD